MLVDIINRSGPMAGSRYRVVAFWKFSVSNYGAGVRHDITVES